jgi:Family of unknown function (DUF5719)
MKLGGRVIGLGLAAILLAAGVGWEVTRGDATRVSLDESERRPAASLATTDATGTLWFCPLVASTSGVAQASLRLSREPGAQTPTVGSIVTISLRGPAGEMVEAQRTVPSAGLVVPITDLLGEVNLETLPSIATVVESSDRSVIVEASLGAKSNGFVPCATTVSAQWFVAEGSTVLGTTMELALFNPFPGNALIDLRFWTERGAARPTALQGLVIPGGAIRIVSVGDFVRRRERVAVEISSRAGRIVPAMHQRIRSRSSLVLATPEASSVWFFPSAMGSDAKPEQFTVVNPGLEEAKVELTATLDPSDIEPFELIVPADSSVVISPTEEGRVPGKTNYAVVAKVISGPDIVVFRTVGNDPKSKTPVFGNVASPLSSSRWVVPTGSSGSEVTIFNPYDDVASVTVQVNGKNVVPGFSVGAGAFKRVPIPKDLAGTPARAVLVRSNGVPVVVSSSQELGGVATDQPGVSAPVLR